MMVLRCPDDFEIDLYLDGELGPEENTALCRHIETCRRCRERIEAEKRFRKALKEIPVIVPPPEFSDRLMSMARQWIQEGSPAPVPSGHAVVSEGVPHEVPGGISPGTSGRMFRWMRSNTQAFVEGLEAGARSLFACVQVRRAVALMLAVTAVLVQTHLGALGIGQELGHGAAPGMEILDEAVTFLETFSFREFMNHVSELWRAFRTGGSDTAVIAMKALFGSESLITIAVGTGLVLVVSWRKRRLRLSED